MNQSFNDVDICKGFINLDNYIYVNYDPTNRTIKPSNVYWSRDIGSNGITITYLLFIFLAIICDFTHDNIKDDKRGHNANWALGKAFTTRTTSSYYVCMLIKIMMTTCYNSAYLDANQKKFILGDFFKLIKSLTVVPTRLPRVHGDDTLKFNINQQRARVIINIFHKLNRHISKLVLDIGKNLNSGLITDGEKITMLTIFNDQICYAKKQFDATHIENDLFTYMLTEYKNFRGVYNIDTSVLQQTTTPFIVNNAFTKFKHISAFNEINTDIYKLNIVSTKCDSQNDKLNYVTMFQHYIKHNNANFAKKISTLKDSDHQSGFESFINTDTMITNFLKEINLPELEYYYVSLKPLELKQENIKILANTCNTLDSIILDKKNVKEKINGITAFYSYNELYLPRTTDDKFRTDDNTNLDINNSFFYENIIEPNTDNENLKIDTSRITEKDHVQPVRQTRNVSNQEPSYMNYICANKNYIVQRKVEIKYCGHYIYGGTKIFDFKPGEPNNTTLASVQSEYKQVFENIARKKLREQGVRELNDTNVIKNKLRQQILQDIFQSNDTVNIQILKILLDITFNKTLGDLCQILDVCSQRNFDELNNTIKAMYGIVGDQTVVGAKLNSTDMNSRILFANNDLTASIIFYFLSFGMECSPHAAILEPFAVENYMIADPIGAYYSLQYVQKAQSNYPFPILTEVEQENSEKKKNINLNEIYT